MPLWHGGGADPRHCCSNALHHSSPCAASARPTLYCSPHRAPQTLPLPHSLNRQVTEPGQSMFDLSAHRFKLMVDWIKTLPGGTETDFVLLSCSGAPRPGEAGRGAGAVSAARQHGRSAACAERLSVLGRWEAPRPVRPCALTQCAALRSAACAARRGPASRLRRLVLTLPLCIISARHTDLTPAIRDKVVTYKRKGEAALRNRCGARRGDRGWCTAPLKGAECSVCLALAGCVFFTLRSQLTCSTPCSSCQLIVC